MRALRAAEVLLGLWLFVSVFVWLHPIEHMVNTWVVGVTIATFSLVAMRVDWVRHLSGAVAAWLLLFTLGTGTADEATAWNNTLIALIVLSTSFVGRPKVHAPPRRPVTPAPT